MTLHISESDLHDYVDGTLDERTRAVAAQHLSMCGACAEQVAALERLRARLRALPRGIEPGNDLLTGIRTRTNRGADAAIPFPAKAQAVPSHRARWPMLAAAAITLVVLSSAVTLLVVRSQQNGAPTAMTPAPVDMGRTQLVDLRATEARYVDAIEELRRALVEDQTVLEPTTLRALEQSLATIDAALAEARAALAADPGNAVLAEMLQANYEQKLDLLRRATVHARARL